MGGDIKDVVANCPTCQKYQSSTPAEFIYQYESPTYPWQYVSTDLFTMAGNEYLLIADQYNRSPFIRRLHSTSSTAVIKNIKAIFKERGIPEILYTDNGPQFASREFVYVSKTYTFLRQTSSPHYLQSNGFAERMIGECFQRHRSSMIITYQ